jgi:CMP-N,N'-diacetyllegionaminic acid synthase
MEADCVAVITARAGSKRIPDKNIRLLAGKPLIAWSVLAALAAKSVRRVIVSTDSDRIAEAAREAGAEVPFRRPDELSGDLAPHYGVVAHAIDWLENDEGRAPDYICLLQPTSPLRVAKDIDGTFELVDGLNADCGFSVSRVSAHPAYLYRLDAAGLAEPYLPKDDSYVRSQDLEPYYFVNGAVYFLRPTTFRQRNTILSAKPAAYVMPAERSVDIDEEHDLIVAEALMKTAVDGAR